MRVVLDTNVLISALAYPKGLPARIFNLWMTGAIEVSLSHYILAEMARVLPRFDHLHLTGSGLQQLIEQVHLKADLVEPALTPDPLLRDQDDQQVLGTLRASGATYLITGDKDLLALAIEYPILTPAQFWERHG